MTASTEQWTEDQIAILTASPWPSRECVGIYKDRLTNHPDPEAYRARVRRTAEHNAMLSIASGDYVGPEGATSANQYRILADMTGARPIHQLRKALPGFLRQEQIKRMMVLHMMDTLARCADMTRAHQRLGLR